MGVRPAVGLALAMRSRAILGVLGLCVAAGQMALAAQAPADVEETYGPTTRDDTLWSIAREVRPPGLTIAETIAALQRMNPHAFVDGDPNVLMRGVMLKVPTTSTAMETSRETQQPEPDPPTEETPAPEPEEILLEENVTPVPIATVDERDLLAIRNAELDERLEAVQTELEVATAKIGALESQISTMRRRLAESERQLAAAQSPVAKDADPTRRNAIMVIALAMLLVVVVAFLYVRNRRGSQAVAGEPARQPLGARRIGGGRTAPKAAPGGPETVPDEYAPATKLNLARAFIDMDRNEQAREVLEEVLAEGSEEERREADELLRRME